MAKGLLPGDNIVCGLGPLFPAATATTIPDFTALFTALTRGSAFIGLLAGVPSDKFNIFVSYLSLLSITQPIAEPIHIKSNYLFIYLK